LVMSVARSSAANTAVCLEPRLFRMWTRPGSSLTQQNCEDGYGSRDRFLIKRHLIWLCKQTRTITDRFTWANNLPFSPDSRL